MSKKYKTKEEYFKFKDAVIKSVKFYGVHKKLTQKEVQIIYDTIWYACKDRYFESEENNLIHFWLDVLEDYFDSFKTKTFLCCVEDVDILDYNKINISEDTLVIVLIKDIDLFDEFWKCYESIDRRILTGSVDNKLKNKFRTLVIWPQNS